MPRWAIDLLIGFVFNAFLDLNRSTQTSKLKINISMANPSPQKQIFPRGRESWGGELFPFYSFRDKTSAQGGKFMSSSPLKVTKDYHFVCNFN